MSGYFGHQDGHAWQIDLCIYWRCVLDLYFHTGIKLQSVTVQPRQENLAGLASGTVESFS